MFADVVYSSAARVARADFADVKKKRRKMDLEGDTVVQRVQSAALMARVGAVEAGRGMKCLVLPLSSVRDKEKELAFDSCWVFHYGCGQVGLAPPRGPHSSIAFDYGL